MFLQIRLNAQGQCYCSVKTGNILHFNVNALKQENSTSPAFPNNFQDKATPYSSLEKQ